MLMIIILLMMMTIFNDEMMNRSGKQKEVQTSLNIVLVIWI